MRRRERLRQARTHEKTVLGLFDRAAGLLDEKLQRLREEGAANGAPLDDELERTWPGLDGPEGGDESKEAPP